MAVRLVPMGHGGHTRLDRPAVVLDNRRRDRLLPTPPRAVRRPRHAQRRAAGTAPGRTGLAVVSDAGGVREEGSAGAAAGAAAPDGAVQEDRRQPDGVPRVAARADSRHARHVLRGQRHVRVAGRAAEGERVRVVAGSDGDGPDVGDAYLDGVGDQHAVVGTLAFLLLFF